MAFSVYSTVFLSALVRISTIGASNDNNMLCNHLQSFLEDPTLDFLKLQDAYKVTWAHAVNSPSKLEEALSSDIMMLEADVQMRHNRTDTEPIMAHPPDTDSNLTLAEFIHNVSKTEKGIKLDFKTLMSVEPSLQLLKNISDSQSLKIPIWLNADILMGPCYDTVCTPVNATEFIALCSKYFPSSVLSLGWKTGINMKPEKNMYQWEHVLEMAKLIHTIHQPITFPVRASLITRSLDQLSWLLDTSGNLSLTVWSAEKDHVKAIDLVELRKKVYDKKTVYYDLPEPQADDFAKALEGVDVSTTKPHNNEIVRLRAYAAQTCTDVLVGNTKIMFSGGGGWVSTTKEIKATSLEMKHLEIEVFFLPLGNQDIQQNITLVLGSDGLTQPTANVKHGSGIQLTLSQNGEMTLTRNDGTVAKYAGVSDPNFQYHLSIVYGPKMGTITFVLSRRDDFEKRATINYQGDYRPEKFFVLIGAGEQEGAVLVNKLFSLVSLPSGPGFSQMNFALLIFIAMIVALGAHLMMSS